MQISYFDGMLNTKQARPKFAPLGIVLIGADQREGFLRIQLFFSAVIQVKIYQGHATELLIPMRVLCLYQQLS